MGLDMYLTGKKFLWSDYINPENDLKEDGFRLESKELSLGYWRKHPDLHGFIINMFADGEDNCQEIELLAEDITKIINAVKEKNLPTTKGFFFGKSDGEEIEEDLKILTKALRWLIKEEKGVDKSVIYRASW